MVQYSSTLQELKQQGLQLLIDDHAFKVCRNDHDAVVILYNGKQLNDVQALDDENKQHLFDVLDSVNFEIIEVKGIDYIFNMGNVVERHRVKVYQYIGEHYDTILNDYDKEQIEICDDGSVFVDGTILQTRLHVNDLQ